MMNQFENEHRTNTEHLSVLGHGGFALAVAVLWLWPVGALIGSPIEGRWSVVFVGTILLLVAISMSIEWGALAATPWRVRFGELLLRTWLVIMTQWFVINLRVIFRQVDLASMETQGDSTWVAVLVAISFLSLFSNLALMGPTVLRVSKLFSRYEREMGRFSNSGPSGPEWKKKPRNEWLMDSAFILSLFLLCLSLFCWIGLKLEQQPQEMVDLTLSVYMSSVVAILQLYLIEAQQTELINWEGSDQGNGG